MFGSRIVAFTNCGSEVLNVCIFWLCLESDIGYRNKVTVVIFSESNVYRLQVVYHGVAFALMLMFKRAFAGVQPT